MNQDDEARRGASPVHSQNLNQRAQDIIQECEAALRESRWRVAESQRLLRKLDALAESLPARIFGLNK